MSGWLPSTWAIRIPAPIIEPMSRNHPRRGVTIHNEGVDRECRRGHVTDLAHYVNDRRINYHFIWCPRCSQWAQLAPWDKASRAQVGDPVWGGASANRAGTVNAAVCVAGYGARDFTDRRHLQGAWVLAEIMDRARVPWKARATWGPGASRGTEAWMRGGVQGHQHGPADDHTDPGAINVERLLREARRQSKARS